MKRTLRTCALIAAIAAPAALSAQSTDKPITFGASGGLSLPMGDLGDVASSGYNITGHVFLKPSALRTVRLRADVSFDRWDYKDVVVFDGSTRSLGLVGNVVYDFPMESSTSIMRPYVLGGLGIYNGKNSDTDEADTNLGIQFGGGLNFQLSGFSTFAEAKFVNVFGDGGSARYVPVTFGVRF